MIIRHVAAFAVAATLVSAGCAKPVLTRRYKALAAGASLGTGDVQLTASVFPIDAPAQRTIFDLAGEGQAALVAAVASVSVTGGSLHSALAAPISRGSTGVVDKTSFSRRIVLSVSADHKGLADRLDFSRITLTLGKYLEAEFRSWNQLATRFDTVDLGKLTFTQKDSLSYGLEGVLPGIGEVCKATTGGARDRIVGEEVQLRQRYVAT